MMKKSILILGALVSVSSAQTIKQCVVDILETNPKVQERLKNYNSVAQEVDIANSEYWPKLDLRLGAGYENTQENASAGSAGEFGTEVYQNSLTYTQNLFKGFQTYHKVQEEEARAAAAAYSFIETSNDVAFEMVNTYLLLMKNIELMGTAQENIDINEEILTKVRKLYKSGLTTRSEVNKIESSLSLARSNYVVQENNMIDAQYNLQRVLGRQINTDKMLRPDLNSTTVPDNVSSATQFSMQNNPSLLVSQYNIKLAQATYKEKKSNYYPHIDIEVSQSLNKNLSAIKGQEQRFRAMAFLSYNFFNGFADQAQVQKNVSKIHQEIQSKNDLRRQVTQGLNLSYASYIKIDEQIVFLERYKEFSKQTLKLYAKEYDLGRRSLLDLLSSQNDFIGSKSQLINSQYSLLFAKYRILDAMGIMVSSILDNTDELYAKVNLKDGEAQVEDFLPVYYDMDNDLIASEKDVCDNTLLGSTYDKYGCHTDDNTTKETRSLGSLVFDDKTQLTNDATDLLEKIKADLSSLDLKLVEIVVYGNVAEGDFKKSEDLNISQQRADIVVEELIKIGVPKANITIIAQGSESPLYSAETSDGKELNNRVDLILNIKAAKE